MFLFSPTYNDIVWKSHTVMYCYVIDRFLGDVTTVLRLGVSIKDIDMSHPSLINKNIFIQVSVNLFQNNFK